MARVSRVEAERNRKRIVEAASRLFSERGIDNVSISEVMLAVGLTHGGFYNHFTSKEELALEAMRTSFGRATENWRRTPCADASERSPLQDLIETYLHRTLVEDRCPLISSRHDAISGNREEYKSTFSSGARQLFEEFSRVAVATDPSMPRWQCATLFAALLGARVLAEAGGNEPWITEIIEAIPEAIPRMRSKTV